VCVTGDRSTGAALSRSYFEDLIEPLMSTRFPGLRYAAGRLGSGSDVIGLDDATSRDHDWGLRLTLIVPGQTVADVEHMLESSLPDAYQGLPTRFPFSGRTAPRLHVDVSSMADFVVPRLGFDPRSPITIDDWLSLSGQSVLEITAGPVFADHDGALGRVRRALDWYPDDLWRNVIACDWARLAQELPLMGRAADVGDDRGSRLIAARSAQVTMHLAFLLERRWAPYAKWFGTAFSTLRCADSLGPQIDRILDGDDRQRREHGLIAALQLLLQIQDDHGLTDVDHATVPFWDRPHIHPNPAIITQLTTAITDARVQSLPLGAGTIEQRTDNVEILVEPAARRRAILG
jgi:hypothetical protein